MQLSPSFGRKSVNVELLSLVFTSDINISTYARTVSTPWFVKSFVLGKYKAIEFN